LALTGRNVLGMALVALIAIAMGTYIMAWQWILPVNVGNPRIFSVNRSTFAPLVGVGEPWTFEAVALTTVAYIFGPPRGRHARTFGGRGLLPAITDVVSRRR
jgi:hypothetical protein